MAISWFLPDDKKTLAIFTFQSNTNMNLEHAEIHNILNYATSKIISTDFSKYILQRIHESYSGSREDVSKYKIIYHPNVSKLKLFNCSPSNANMFT